MGKAGKKGGKKSGADSKAAVRRRLHPRPLLELTHPHRHAQAKAAKKLKQESKQAKSDTKQIKKKKGKAADKARTARILSLQLMKLTTRTTGGRVGRGRLPAISRGFSQAVGRGTQGHRSVVARSHRLCSCQDELTLSTLTEDVVEGPPSRRANATFSASPVSDHLYLFGGEFYDGQRVEMYADVRLLAVSSSLMPLS